MPQPKTQTIKASQARQQFSQLVNRVFRKETRILVEKSGIPVAAIVSVEDLERLNRLDAERAGRFKALDASWKAFEGVPVDEVEQEIARAVANAQQKHRRATQRPARAS